MKNNTMSIDDVLSRYKADFERIWKEERYKWAAVKHYKDTWKIDAPDFASMLAEGFSKAASGPGALLAGGMYYPYKMITAFAREDPETVRSMFLQLYDESLPLAFRYTEFRAGCDKCLAAYRGNWEDRSKIQNHYQDLRAISVYLSFEYPDTYFLYKYKMYTQFRDLVGFPEKKGNTKSEIWKLENYGRLCRAVLDVIQRDEQLLQMQKGVLDDDCWPDKAYHLLTQTVIYVGSFIGRPTHAADAPLRRTAITERSVKIADAPQAGTVIAEQPVRVADAPPVAGEKPENGVRTVTDVAKNTILYGPPGTGKTYHTVFYAVAVIENRPLASVQAEKYSAVLARYHKYRVAGLIEFTTFHQSYGYEEFIEGIRPVLSKSGGIGGVQYRLEDGVFLRFCTFNDFERAWNLLCSDAQAQAGEYTFVRRTGSEVSAVLVDSTRFRVNWESEQGSHNDLKKSAIKKQFEAHRDEVRDQLKGGSKWLFDAQQAVIDVLITKYHLADAPNVSNKNRVFIIDEINRGNISKIFGELITLIEPSKRIGQPEGITVRLPYSKKAFGIPDNVYLIGTMNTADRSIAALDTALRRRFQFREMQPDPEILAGIRVEDLSIQDMLIRMNEKICVLYDREHTVGHAYFMPLEASPTIETLASIFEHSILPLLQEYFYDDYEKIRLVLGDNNKPEQDDQFIIARTEDYGELFGSTDVDLDGSIHYEINKNAFDNIEAYRSI